MSYTRGGKAKLESVVRELGCKLGAMEIYKGFNKSYYEMKRDHDKALRMLNSLNKVA